MLYEKMFSQSVILFGVNHGSTHKTCKGCSQTEKRKWTWILTITRKLLMICPHWQREKSLFSNSVSKGVSNPAQDKPYVQEELTNTKQTQWYFSGFFASFCFILAFFFLLVFCLFDLCLLFVLLLYLFWNNITSIWFSIICHI